MTVSAFLAHLAETGKAENTILAYRADLTQLEQFLVRTRRTPEVVWSRLSVVELAAWYVQLEAGHPAPATLRRKLAAVRVFLRFAGLDRQASALPTIPHTPRTAARTLTDDEAERLLASPDTRSSDGLRLRDRALLRLMLGCGLKVSEVVGLGFGDLDLATGYVRVGGRDVPFGLRAGHALADYLGALKPRGRPRDPVFVNAHGERLTRQGLWVIVGVHARACRLSWLTPEAIRLTCARKQIELGTSWYDTARFLGLGTEYSLRRRLGLAA